jgi:hypothetical protein
MKFKFKPSAEVEAERSAAANWNQLVSKIIEGNPESKSEDITPDSLLEALSAETDVTELQSKLQIANEKVTEQAATIQTLNKTIEEQNIKLGSPGDETGKVKKETDSEHKTESKDLLISPESSKRVETVRAIFNALPE